MVSPGFRQIAIRQAVPDGGSALSGLRGVVGRVSAAPPGKQCLMATSSYQAYGVCNSNLLQERQQIVVKLILMGNGKAVRTIVVNLQFGAGDHLG